MALFYVPDIARTWELSDEEAAHALRVLRLTVGAELEITDGKGNLYRTAIASIAGKHCYVEPCAPLEKPKNWRGNVHIAIAPTKNMDRIEWFAEKATEIGLDAITFLNCRFSERKVIKPERVERIVVSAMKQSLKYSKPVVSEMVYLESASASFYIEDKELVGVTYRNDIPFKFYPIDQVPDNQERRLPGFKWVSELRPTRESTFNRTIRPSEREDKGSRKRPSFSIVEKMDRRKEQLMREGVWYDREDELSPDIIEWRDSRVP